VTCVHNPEAGHEAEFPALLPAPRRRNVLVVGGGPAGMEAARVAALRGHRVTLVERSAALGGTPRAVAAAGLREPFGLVSSWLAARLAELPVEVRLGVEVTAALVSEARPDAVVLATGGRPRPAGGPSGAELRHVTPVRSALAGSLPGSGRVVVLDRQGGYPAIDAATLAAGRGRPVTVVSEDTFAASQLGATGELAPWYRAAAGQGIELRPMTTVLEIAADSLLLRHRFGCDEERLAADCVVVADHELPDDALHHELAAGEPRMELHRVGDCLAPRRVLQAVLEGGRAGRAV
jgi:2,4-dienoyl-CoA reductase (NADPH2)